MPRHNPEIAEKSGYNCAACNRPDDAEADMVFCDHCQRWFHFGCVGVTEEVKDVSWCCSGCTKDASGGADSFDLQEELTRLEDERKKQKRELEKERILHRKRLELQQEMFAARQKLEKEKREMELEFEKGRMEKIIEEEKAHQMKLDQMRLETQEKLKLLKLKHNTDEVEGGQHTRTGGDAEGEEKGSKNKKKKEVMAENANPGKKPVLKKSRKEKPGKADLVVANNGDIDGAYRKFSTPKKAGDPVEGPSRSLDTVEMNRDERSWGGKGTPFGHPEVRKQKKKQSRGQQDSDGAESESGDDVEEKVADAEASDNDAEELDSSKSSAESVESESCSSRQRQSQGPTKAQLSARQFLSRRLPIFTGKLEEWPMFISSYETSTEACGFSNVENLARLQESLKGQALEAVRSRLLLPTAVPEIIKTLRMLYGRPEQLLNMLLSKVRKTAPPKADRLASFISFGMVVQQLADHLEATGLTTHLVNPMLIQELTEKLPAGTQLEWVRYRRKSQVVTLRTLANFLSAIVEDASEITLYGQAPPSVESEPRRGKRTGREHEGFLHAHDVTESKNYSSSAKQRTPCRICNRVDHRIRNCEKFRKLRVEEKWEAVRKWNMCPVCLNEHGSTRCKLNFRCNVGACNEHHNSLLHPGSPATHSNCNIHSIQPKQSVIFRIMPVTLYWENNAINTTAFLDEGSSYTLLEKSLANVLSIKGTIQPLRVTWTAGVSRLEKESRRVDLFISAQGSNQRFRIKGAHTVEDLKLPQHSHAMSQIAKQYCHLQGLPIQDAQQVAPQILIGLNDIHLYAPLESRVGKPGEPIAVRSKLGWAIYGPTNVSSTDAGIVCHHMCSNVTNQELRDLLKSQFALEESTISVALLPESKEDKRAKQLLEKTTVRIGDRFETGLLWRDEEPQFPDSYFMASKRLQCLENRLKKDGALYDKVRQMVAEYLDKGYAHKATESELSESDPSRIWYVPLNIVSHPKKQKLRLVWDARAEVKGVSLNSKLLKGPDMLTALPAVICRFRERRVGFGADIKEMYHQLRIREQDKQAQRFLFRTDTSMKPEVYVMDVATFGSTSSPCSAQYVKNLNAKQFAKQFPEAAKAIVENHYVDDYFDSAETVEEAVKRAKEVRYVHSKAGFLLRNWVSNSEEFLHALGERNENQFVHFNDKESGHERVLGIAWNPGSDEFLFSTKLRDDLEPYLSGGLRPTKRVVMSCVMSFFDPLGLLSFFTIHGKILIQDLWRSGCDWDQKIDDECTEKGNRWIEQLPEIEKVRIPRYYFNGGRSLNENSLQLHVFVDASESAYGAAAYLRIETADGPLCSLVMARSKVAPLKHLSIPRLELQAAVVGVRLAKTVVDMLSFEIKSRFIWTDSKTVLSWIYSDHRKYKQYVAFRIGEVLSLSNIEEWNWVPSRWNVADKLTKWEKGLKFGPSEAWYRAPTFLYEARNQWPKQSVIVPNVSEELRAVHLFHDVSLVEELNMIERISMWRILVRSVACVFRFASNCRRKREGLPIEAVPARTEIKRCLKRNIPSVVVPLKRMEYQKAEACLWRWAQSNRFAEEIKTLKKNRDRELPKQYRLEKSSELYSLSPFIDEQDVLRMEGRTAQGLSVPFELRFPIILPKRHPITDKLLQFYHQQR
ncbi:uncharacterized protein LOC128741066 [Sabethes cyaneus]|uniref:uncharacterized protein LOC128741066 n=1 Tax=Sabethes cyaneus TaxID=53552 RepID=UPI00237E965B|nr:uncharacterized protein LOC128741066 [Sabethes cyaneus]